jgi:Flp pilus assembly pilin Flp
MRSFLQELADEAKQRISVKSLVLYMPLAILIVFAVMSPYGLIAMLGAVFVVGAFETFSRRTEVQHENVNEASLWTEVPAEKPPAKAA